MLLYVYMAGKYTRVRRPRLSKQAQEGFVEAQGDTEPCLPG